MNAEANPTPAHGTRWRLLVFALVALGVAAVLAPVAGYMDGWAGALSALAAGGLCLACFVGACLLGRAFSQPAQVHFQVLFGMAIRMGVPFAACLLAYMQHGFFVETLFIYYVLAFYFALLMVEIGFAAATKSAPHGAHDTAQAG